MTPNNSVGLSQLLAAQAGGRLPLSTAFYACTEVARLVAVEHERNQTVKGLDVDHIFCTRDGAVILAGARAAQADTRADVHAVGALFYRLLTGKVAPSRDVVAPSHFNPGVDRELDAVILKALAVDASQRPASVRVLESALTGIFEELELTPSPEELAQAVKAVPVVHKVKVVQPTVHHPPVGWYAAGDDADEDSAVGVPSWQTQERERKWMVAITAALVTVGLLWALWPAPKMNRASLGETPSARVASSR